MNQTHRIATVRVREQMVRSAFCILLVSAAVCPLAAQENASATQETASIFQRTRVPVVRLQLSEAAQDQLRNEPREYARCEWIADGREAMEVAVKLKGAAGSYRDFDDRPGLTLNMDRFVSDQRFHGMKKFHLNNAVQDETFLSEWLGSEFFREAGIDAPRVGHVRLWINERDMGLYVLREGFDSPYLKRRFGDRKGRLYDGGFAQDIDSDLELDAGDETIPKTDLIALALACFHADPEVRTRAIEARLDLDAFMTFMAMERIVGHWDGYSLSQNNYRLYFPPQGKAVFLPHGMDQLLGDPEAGLYDHSSSLLAAAVMQSDAWRSLYQQRLKRLVARLPTAEVWMARMAPLERRLQTALQAIDPELASSHRDRLEELKERLTQRLEALPRLVEEIPIAVDFDAMDAAGEEALTLVDWFPAPESEPMSLEMEERDGVSCYSIAREAFGDFAGSWRCQVLLPRGKYRMRARVKTEDVIPIPEDPMAGVGLRRIPFGSTQALFGSHD